MLAWHAGAQNEVSSPNNETLLQLAAATMSWEPLVTYLSLQVVSTQVGGVPEVLPSDLIRLAEPNTSGYNTVVRPTWFGYY